MNNAWKLSPLTVAIAAFLASGPAAAAPGGAEPMTVAMTANVSVTPTNASLRQSADDLFECRPLNIDGKSMTCNLTTFDFVTLARVPFEHDKFSVNDQAAQSLDAAAIYLLLNLDKVHRVFINGHADSSGTDAYNERLAGKRANAVRKYLINRGITGDRLALGSSGERQPIDEHWTPEGQAHNRDVSLYVVMRHPTP